MQFLPGPHRRTHICNNIYDRLHLFFPPSLKLFEFLPFSNLNAFCPFKLVQIPHSTMSSLLAAPLLEIRNNFPLSGINFISSADSEYNETCIHEARNHYGELPCLSICIFGLKYSCSKFQLRPINAMNSMIQTT